MKWLGDKALLEREKTAFVCSQGTPRSFTVIIRQWALQVDAGRDCVLCGNESEMEQMVFSVLLMRRVPLILLMAQSLPSVLPLPWQRAVDEGRLLIGTHCSEAVHSMTRDTAIDRNRIMLDMAHRVVVGYYTRGSEVERSIRGRASVHCLLHPGT